MSSSISLMPSEIAAWLRQQIPLQGIEFITEYPATKKAVPLKQAIVAVGLENVSITDKFVDNGQGVLEAQEYCRSAKLRIRLGIHAPYSLGGDYCHSVFTKVADCMTFGSDLEITQSAAGRIKSDRDTDAFVLECYLDVFADFCPAVSTGLSFPSFMNKELLCGSHINNQDIHFTGSEKELFLQPFVAGSYTGSGTTSQVISLGFKPRLVIVFTQDFPTITNLPNSANYGSYFAIGLNSSQRSLGIEMGNSGFTVRNNDSVRDMVAKMNELGFFYSYLAFR
ncbi:MAG: hypothetical protein FWG82_01550 [Oscillospiraceae bacterium]|nr:hypothetical protein [Oscillospiraceae bacterium]